MCTESIHQYSLHLALNISANICEKLHRLKGKIIYFDAFLQKQEGIKIRPAERRIKAILILRPAERRIKAILIFMIRILLVTIRNIFIP